MTLSKRNNLKGGLQYPPNRCILNLGDMKGHPEMGQSQNVEGWAIETLLLKYHSCCIYITLHKYHTFQKRISCINTMLHKCHVKWQICFVGDCCINVTVPKISHQKPENDPHRWKMPPPMENYPPPVENDPSDGK